jgi:quinoprotein glucose dehydrogenase
MPERNGARRTRNIPRLVLAIVIGLIGLWLFGFGAYLAALGGSIYYVIAGAALIASAVL